MKSLIQLLLVFLIVGCSGSEEKKKVFTEADALTKSWYFVKQNLKSPSTADFPYSTDGVIKLSDTTFIVRSYLDSQNGFGAMIRSNYSCKITFIPTTDIVQVDDLIIK